MTSPIRGAGSHYVGSNINEARGGARSVSSPPAESARGKEMQKLRDTFDTALGGVGDSGSLERLRAKEEQGTASPAEKAAIGIGGTIQKITDWFNKLLADMPKR